MIPVGLLHLSHIATFKVRVTAIIMPDDVAEEKVKALSALGADVQRVRPASIVDKKQVCVFIYVFTHAVLSLSLKYVVSHFILTAMALEI